MKAYTVSPKLTGKTSALGAAIQYHQAMKAPTVDNVCATYADKGVRVTMKALPEQPELLLIEGDELAFEFLGRLFLAQAKTVNGCGFWIEPHGPGNALFTKKSTLGLYLHRLPCDNPKPKRLRSKA